MGYSSCEGLIGDKSGGVGLAQALKHEPQCLMGVNADPPTWSLDTLFSVSKQNNSYFFTRYEKLVIGFISS
jgi:hypothetical protein